MHKFTVDPLVTVRSDLSIGVDALHIVAQTHHGLIFGIQQGDSSLEFRHDHQVLPSVHVCGESISGKRLKIFAIHVENLQRIVRPVRHDNGGLFTRPTINPDAVGGIECAFTISPPAKAGQPFRIFIVPMDVAGTVTVSEEKTTVVQKREICG